MTMRLLPIAASAALLGVSVSPPVADFAERSFAVHMGQHLLLADAGGIAFALAAGSALGAGVLVSMRRQALAAAAVLGWWLVLALVHVPALYDAALGGAGPHLVQHALLLGSGALAWGVVLGAGGAGRLGAGARVLVLLAMQLAGIVLGNLLLWSGTLFYPARDAAERLSGLSALEDQRLGGAIMLGEGMLVTLAMLAWLLHRVLQQEEGVSAGSAAGTPGAWVSGRSSSSSSSRS